MGRRFLSSPVCEASILLRNPQPSVGVSTDALGPEVVLVGELVLEDVNVPRETGSETVSYTWLGAQMQEGMIYQFRVVSYHDPKKNETQRAYISATEDLRGVFQYGAQAQGDGT